MKKVGFIGLGLMGKPMSSRLISAGYEVIVHNRSISSSEEISAKGAEIALSPKDVASKVDVVISMLPDSDDVEKVAIQKNGVCDASHEGLIYVDMSTISPSVTRRISKTMNQYGIRMLDAPVSGGVWGAENGTLSIMVGGDESAFNDCLDIFNTLGKTIVYHGKSGLGQVTKLCNQVLTALHIQAICEALTLGGKAGLDLDKLLESVSGGAAGSWALNNLAPRIVKKDLEPGFKASHQNKDLRHVLNLADELKLPLPGVALVRQLFSALEAEGKGNKGTQALISIYNKLSGIEE
tara:strand:- start:390 stop:1271 length:882 start_codon:yes stop_codon:yes gene_type:complete